MIAGRLSEDELQSLAIGLVTASQAADGVALVALLRPLNTFDMARVIAVLGGMVCQLVTVFAAQAGETPEQFIQDVALRNERRTQ